MVKYSIKLRRWIELTLKGSDDDCSRTDGSSLEQLQTSDHVRTNVRQNWTVGQLGVGFVAVLCLLDSTQWKSVHLMMQVQMQQKILQTSQLND